jgi:two-component system, OmpR family, osmolarity sensor histidine kinase EnvZ
MAERTLFRRLVVAQTLAAFALLLVFTIAFYVERNRTVVKLAAERWAPALRTAAGLDPAAAPAQEVIPVRLSEGRPLNAIPSLAWAPRIAALRSTLREAGVPAGEVVFTPGMSSRLTWIEVSVDGGVRWLGIDDHDNVVEPYLLLRLGLALVLGLAVVFAASWVLARHLTRPLEALRQRIESHTGKEAQGTPQGEPTLPGRPTLEITAIDSAWLALTARLAHQESERALLLAGVSHDLRSPLARIRMAAELLPETDPIAGRRASIVRNVDVADRLIASFLDYVRSTTLPLDSTVDIVSVARQLLDALDQPEDVLTIAAPGRLDVTHTHEMLLERLLANLVDNAMRHGQAPVLIRLATEGRDTVLEVVDHGPGIAPEAQAHLTQAFARGEASRGTPGTGLGLAIVQQIVHRMGGTLSFHRSTGTSCVRVRLPKR